MAPSFSAQRTAGGNRRPGPEVPSLVSLERAGGQTGRSHMRSPPTKSGSRSPARSAGRALELARTKLEGHERASPSRRPGAHRPRSPRRGDSAVVRSRASCCRRDHAHHRPRGAPAYRRDGGRPRRHHPREHSRSSRRDRRVSAGRCSISPVRPRTLGVEPTVSFSGAVDSRRPRRRPATGGTSRSAFQRSSPRLGAARGRQCRGRPRLMLAVRDDGVGIDAAAGAERGGRGSPT
jgi:hypothetical protein